MTIFLFDDESDESDESDEGDDCKMSEMYKIVRYVPEGMPLGGCINGATKHHGFKSAKRAMYATIETKFAGMQQECSDLIDKYCAEYYPEGAPENFNMLKQFINEYLSDPENFEFEDKYAELDFEDDRISFGLSFEFMDEGINRVFYIEVTDDAKWKFPEGVITAFELKELTSSDSEQYVLLTARENIGLEIVYSLMTEEDENDMFFEN